MLKSLSVSETQDLSTGLSGHATMVRRGLSLEEKREKILDIYHSTKKVYSLKEIEKAASKQGVTSITVKVQ